VRIFIYFTILKLIKQSVGCVKQKRRQGVSVLRFNFRAAGNFTRLNKIKDFNLLDKLFNRVNPGLAPPKKYYVGV